MTADALAWTTFALSLIGAGAWLPSIWGWFQRPKLQIVFADAVEVGFVEFGAVLNIGCAVVSENKAALVESVSLIVEHESGARTEMQCVGLGEGTVARSSTGENVIWNRQAQVHTLFIAENAAAERLAMFRDRALMASLRELFRRTALAAARLQEANPAAWREAMRAAPELDEWRQTVRNSFPWNRGTYKGYFRLHVRGLSNLVHRQFQFSLTDADVRGLRGNLDGIDRYIIASMVDDKPLQRPQLTFTYPARAE